MSLFSSVRIALPLSFALLAGCAAPVDDGALDTATDALKASDLTKDLAKPGGWRGTPFENQATKEVSAALATPLRDLVERCIQYRETPTTLLPTANLCPTEIFGIVRNHKKVTEKATVRLGNTTLTAVIWDNEDSDGGDAQDLAIYDAAGKRLGVYRTFFARNDTVLDLLHAAFSGEVTPVVVSEDDHADAVMKAVVNDVVAACHKAAPQAECTFAASLFATSTSQWQSLASSAGGPKVLATEASMKDAMKRCLFSTFAYGTLTASQKDKAANALYGAIAEKDGTLGLYEASLVWRPALESVRTELLDSAAVGGPKCSLVLKLQHSSHFAEVASDVQD